MPGDLTKHVGLPRPLLAAALARDLPVPAAGSLAIAAASRLWAHGGRAAAIERLGSIDPEAYGRTRNHVGGAVTRLSPWLRHGVLSLAEVRDAALARARRPEDADRLISELGWREYWHLVQAAIGDRIHAPLEPLTRIPRGGPGPHDVPADVLDARTGMRCVDTFVGQLHETGWLHNHERMWLASWLVHARGVPWQAGADWFVSHLIDGDPASNHLSWQWVAGSFSAKPYIFNRENLETFTAGDLCRPCGLRGSCDVEGSYDAVAERWFSQASPPARAPLRIRPSPWPAWTATAARQPLVWLTLDSLGATSPAVAAHPTAPRLFVVDPAWLAAERPSLNRLVFVFECLADMPGIEVVLGDPADVVPSRAAAHGCDGVLLAETSCPRVRCVAEAIHMGGSGGATGGRKLPVAVARWPAFCDRSRVSDLGRFSRFWSRVAHSAMQPTQQH